MERQRITGEVARCGRQVGPCPPRYWSVVGLFLLVAIALLAGPGLAHGGGRESEHVDLIEQGLAIVVNPPRSMGDGA